MNKSSFLIIFLFQLSFSYGQVEIQYTALHTSDVEHDFVDLKTLNKNFEGVKLVGMGESTHGTHEFFTMRHRVFKYLVLEHNFNTFFLEADYANCLLIDKYIKGANGDINELISNIDMWPWITEEMKDLVEWMKAYNNEHPKSMLNFIGCDMQRIKTTINEIDNIILKYDQKLVDTAGYGVISDTGFMSFPNQNKRSMYNALLEQKDKVIVNLSITPKERFIYQTLKRHYAQMTNGIGVKDGSYRDGKMAENIIYHFDNNKLMKGFFWAHNAHIFTVLKKRRKEKNSFYRAGGVLKKHFGKAYYAIAQEFDQGSFNAYRIIDVNGNKDDLKNYHLGKITIEPSVKNTFGEYFRDVEDSIIFIPSINLQTSKQKHLEMHNIGASFIPSTKNIHQASYFGSCNGCFDAMIIIKTSTATRFLKSTALNTHK